MSEPLRPCGVCDEQSAHLYPCGWRCDRCSPWAKAGKPDPSVRPHTPISRVDPPDLPGHTGEPEPAPTGPAPHSPDPPLPDADISWEDL